MDTLSTSISTSFTIPKSKSNLKNHHLLPSTSTSTSTSITKPNTTKLSNKTTSFSTQNHLRPPHTHITSRPSSPLKLRQYPPEHRRPSTGYAVALLDAARRQNAVEAVRRDVRRLSRWLGDEQFRRAMADPSTAKGELVKEVVKQGRFEKLVVRLVKMLVEKCKVDLIGQVLSEFGSIYDELSLSLSLSCRNEQLLLLPSALKMEEDHILEIVYKIQTQTGADKVTVRKL